MGVLMAMVGSQELPCHEVVGDPSGIVDCTHIGDEAGLPGADVADADHRAGDRTNDDQTGDHKAGGRMADGGGAHRHTDDPDRSYHDVCDSCPHCRGNSIQQVWHIVSKPAQSFVKNNN